MTSAVSLAITIAVSGKYIDKIGRRIWLIWTTVGVAILVYPCRYFSKTVQLPVCFGFIHRYGVN